MNKGFKDKYFIFYSSFFYFNHHNGKLGFTDSEIIPTMVEHNIKKLVTFDKAFKQESQIEVIGM